jgi:ubiquinone/menaquinone biosynthesis C-methylase UbiE|tara:strand:+ start:746 stop:1411 length:666 start_codon:yes stop_codon:yes gene_type:complete
MGIERNFISKLHNSTNRKYLERMNDNKIHCMDIAKKYEKKYWDGDRRYGYGGYKYIKGRWAIVAKNLIKNYKLKAGSKILDVGCGKGYLLKELLILEPKLKIYGIEPSKHAQKFIDKQIKKNILIQKAQKKLPYKNNYFDLVISLATLHNLEIFDLAKAIKEIERVGKKKYIMLESYRNNKELFNLQCWALTCETFFSKNEWIWFYRYLKYSGDYEFIYFN